MRILLFGLGSIAKKHLKALQQLNVNAEVYALRSRPDAEKVENVINIFDLKEINFKPDFIIISNPTSEHFKTIQESLAFSCPVFIEKPSLHSLTGADVLLDQVEAANLITYVACNLRFHKCIAFLKEALQKSDKRINEVNIYAGSNLANWRPGVDFRKVYSANKELGGGAHLDLIHELDYCYWLFGKPVKVNRLLRNNSSLEISAVDYANYSVIYENFVVNIILNYYRVDNKRTCEIVFEDDTWNVNLLDNSVNSNSSGLVFKSDNTIQDTYESQMEYFISCISKGLPTMNDLRTSLEVLNICIGND
jgi:predicted dehydrogenase